MFGVPVAELGEEVWAAIVLRDGSAATQEALRDHCRARLAPYKLPARFLFLDALPRNSAGKVLKPELTALAQRGG